MSLRLVRRRASPGKRAGPDLDRDLPYIGMFLEMMARGEDAIEQTFGRHIHVGYWPEPAKATGEVADFAAAAERLVREVCDAASFSDGMAVLDAGCGFGGTIRSLNQWHQGMRLCGLNIDRRQIEVARATVTASHGNDITFIAGDACDLPFADDSFDRVLAVEAIFHFSDRARFFQEARRVLKPGGRLAITDFVPAGWIVPQLWLQVAADFFGTYDLRYSIGGYRRLAQVTGFRLSVSRDISRNTYPTFAFVRGLRPLLEAGIKSSSAEITLLQAASRLRIIRYSILAFDKL